MQLITVSEKIYFGNFIAGFSYTTANIIHQFKKEFIVPINGNFSMIQPIYGQPIYSHINTLIGLMKIKTKKAVSFEDLIFITDIMNL